MKLARRRKPGSPDGCVWRPGHEAEAPRRRLCPEATAGARRGDDGGTLVGDTGRA